MADPRSGHPRSSFKHIYFARFVKFYASNFLSCISCVILLFKNRFVSCRVLMLDQMKVKEQFLNDKVMTVLCKTILH